MSTGRHEFDRIMSLQEASDYLGTRGTPLSAVRLRQFAEAGRLGAKRVGNSWLVLRRSIEALAEGAIDRRPGRPPWYRWIARAEVLSTVPFDAQQVTEAMELLGAADGGIVTAGRLALDFDVIAINHVSAMSAAAERLHRVINQVVIPKHGGANVTNTLEIELAPQRGSA